MAIKIPVSAQFDAAELKQQIQMVNDQIKIMANTVGMANKQTFNPISLRSKEDLDSFIKQSQKLLKVQTELNQKMGQSGQGGKNPFMADWSKLYSDQAQRVKKMQSALQFMGVEFETPAAPKPKPPATTPTRPPATPSPSNQSNPWAQAGGNIVGSAFRAAGPIGGVFANAGGAMMAGGAGAGLAGLAGGLAALAVGAVVGKAVEKIGDSQQLSMMVSDMVRRQGGGSYAGSRAALYAGSTATGMTVNDFAQFTGNYQRQSNFRGSPLALASAAQRVGEFGRGYGLTPGEASPMFAGASSMNIVNNPAQMTKLGLLIGEGISKSAAFSQADQMMQAVAGYMQQTARQSLTTPNTAGYIGALSGLAGGKIPGLDVTASASLLNRINASLSQGGAAGDPSQFLTARAGMANGIRNPFQLQLLREGGAFATPDQMLGAGSQYGKRFGKGPKGSQTLLEMTLAQLRKNYGAGTPEYYQAVSRHLGTGLNEAMALDDLKPNDVTGTAKSLQRMGMDLASVNMNSVPDLVRINGAGRGGASTVATQLLNRTGASKLDEKERQRLTAAMNNGSDDELKKVTSELIAAKGMTKTEGDKTRDALTGIANTFQKYSDQAIPLLNTSMQALVTLTGKTPGQMRRDYLEAEHKENLNNISDANKERVSAANSALRQWQQQHALDPRNADYFAQENTLKKNVTDAQTDADAQTAKENARYSSASSRSPTSDERQKIDSLGLDNSAMQRARGMEKDFQDAATKYGVPVERLRAIAATETGFRNNLTSGKGALGPMQVMPGNAKGRNLRNQRQNIMAGAETYAWAMRMGGGDNDEALRWYNGGKNRGSTENVLYPEKVKHYESVIAEKQDAANKIPDAMRDRGQNINLRADPIEIHHIGDNGQVMRKQEVQLRQYQAPNSFANRPAR